MLDDFPALFSEFERCFHLWLQFWNDLNVCVSQAATLRLNSAAQYFTSRNDDAVSPYTASNASLICIGVLPFKDKYLMTARFSIFFIFIITLTSILKRLSNKNYTSNMVEIFVASFKRYANNLRRFC